LLPTKYLSAFHKKYEKIKFKTSTNLYLYCFILQEFIILDTTIEFGKTTSHLQITCKVPTITIFPHLAFDNNIMLIQRITYFIFVLFISN